MVEEVLDQWYGPQDAFYKVRADDDTKRKVLQVLESAARGFGRLRAVTQRLDPHAVETLLTKLQAPPIAEIADMKTLHDVVKLSMDSVVWGNASCTFGAFQIIARQRIRESESVFGLRSIRLSRKLSLTFPSEASLARVSKISPALKKRAAQIKLLLMDVDGTMTDGSVTLLSQPDGTALEIKTFDAHDGQGLTLAQTAGLRTGSITGRESAALLRRAHEMKMEFIFMKQPVKMLAYEEILKKAGVSDSAVAFIGDDLPDIPLMRRVGLAVAVGDAAPEVKEAAHHVTIARGGDGAVREAVELILKSKGIWEAMIDKARA